MCFGNFFFFFSVSCSFLMASRHRRKLHTQYRLRALSTSRFFIMIGPSHLLSYMSIVVFRNVSFSQTSSNWPIGGTEGAWWIDRGLLKGYPRPA